MEKSEERKSKERCRCLVTNRRRASEKRSAMRVERARERVGMASSMAGNDGWGCPLAHSVNTDVLHPSGFLSLPTHLITLSSVTC